MIPVDHEGRCLLSWARGAPAGVVQLFWFFKSWILHRRSTTEHSPTQVNAMSAFSKFAFAFILIAMVITTAGACWLDHRYRRRRRVELAAWPDWGSTRPVAPQSIPRLVDVYMEEKAGNLKWNVLQVRDRPRSVFMFCSLSVAIANVGHVQARHDTCPRPTTGQNSTDG